MSQMTSFWTRLRQMFGPGAAPSGDGADPLAAGRESGALRLRTSPARESQQRVAQLAEALESHFERQDSRAAELAQTLEGIGRTLADLAGAQRSQSDYLKTIATNSESASRHAAALSDTVGRVPDALMTQAEAIRAVAEQVRAAQENDQQLMQALRRFGEAVDALGAAGQAQVATLQNLHAAQRDQSQALTGLVREQTRRFLWVIVVASILGLGALAALVVTLLLQVGR